MALKEGGTGLLHECWDGWDGIILETIAGGKIEKLRRQVIGNFY